MRSLNTRLARLEKRRQAGRRVILVQYPGADGQHDAQQAADFEAAHPGGVVLKVIYEEQRIEG